MNDEAEKLFLPVGAVSPTGAAGGTAATAAPGATATVASRPPGRASSAVQRSGTHPANSAATLAAPTISAPVASTGPSRTPRPSSSGTSLQQREPRGSESGGSNVASGAPPGSAIPQGRKGSAARAAAAATAVAAAAATGGGVAAAGEGGDGRRQSSQGSVAAAPARRSPAGSDAGRTPPTQQPRTPPRSPIEQDSRPPAIRQSPGGTGVPPASPPGATSAWLDGAGEGARRGAVAANPHTPSSRTTSDSGRFDASLPQKPPLPSQASPPKVPAAAAAACVGGDDDLRPGARRSSSGRNSSFNGLGPDELAVGGGDGVAVASVRSGAAGSGTAGVRERRVSSGGHTAAAEKVVVPHRSSPRESSCSGGVRDVPPAAAAAASLLRSYSGSQRPLSPVQSQQYLHPKHQQQHQQQPEQPSRPSYSQQQQQQHATNRAVRFPGSNSGLGSGSVSPVGRSSVLPVAAGPPPTMRSSNRRVSDSSSHVSYSPFGGREVGGLAAPPPPPPGLLPQRRPSEDAVAVAAAECRDRSSNPSPANVIWALSTQAGASSRPGSGGSTRNSQRSSADGAPAPAGCGGAAAKNPVAAAGGGKRSSGSGLHAARAAAAAGAAGGGSGVRRAVDLTPLSLPGEPDGKLREALARTAVTNVALLTTGALLPEPDFGYARVVEQHRRPAQQRQEQQQRSAAGEHAPGRAPRRASLQFPSEVESEAPCGASNPPEAAAAAAPSPPASPRGAAATAVPRAARPPLAAKSTRSVLKSTPHGGGGGGGATGSPVAGDAAPPTHGSAATLATTSYRFLGLRRPSSKASAGDFDGENFTSPGNSTAAAGGGRGGWAGTFGRSESSAAAAAAAVDPDPMGLRTAENVEVRIHCLTYNMGGASPAAAVLPESLFSGSYLSPDAAADAAHLYVFATQESGPLAEWEAAVGAHLGRRYARVAAESLMSIHILLFAVRSMAPYITDVRTSSVATGVGNVLGNKGGVAVTFTLLGARVLLVGAHFAAHDQHVERRNADFHRICAGLFASTDGGTAAGTSPTLTRSAQDTPERQRGGGAAGAEGSVSAAAPVPSDSPPSRTGIGSEGAAAATGGGGKVLARNGTSTASAPRRAPLGPMMSRFGRGNGNGGGVTFGGVDAAAAAAGGNGSQSGRTLTRALSTSSVSSLASNVSAYPGSSAAESALRSRVPSFWGGLGSFATAQRHSTALLAHFDVVLWMGDLNYRIAGTPEVVKYAIDENMMEVLRANDQLHKQQKKGKVLQGFKEMPIAFAPTFKFTRGTDDYDLRRAPSWTDRVLYLVHADPLFADLRPLYYMSVPELRTSDHKPVIAGFELSISPQHAGDNRHARQRGCVIS